MCSEVAARLLCNRSFDFLAPRGKYTAHFTEILALKHRRVLTCWQKPKWQSPDFLETQHGARSQVLVNDLGFEHTFLQPTTIFPPCYFLTLGTSCCTHKTSHLLSEQQCFACFFPPWAAERLRASDEQNDSKLFLTYSSKQCRQVRMAAIIRKHAAVIPPFHLFCLSRVKLMHGHVHMNTSERRTA